MEAGIKRVARMSEYHHTLSHCLLKHRENSPHQTKSKMKLIVALAFLAVALAAPQGDKKPIEIISSNSEMNADGSYSFAFESEDGTKVEESGNQKQVGPKPEDIGTVSRGSYSYTSPDGVVITVNWTADENGFQATGDHLPTPPPMPEHVVKMLADLKAAGLL
ncbi:endocuticle structural glycoprotein SgAbd-3-like isoform X4 [Daphnia pulex]|uniref:endocuticle structural glycoprotein SgAbd-3-like isoform X1 n=2 Tax=Daphnia TaxID=6668 RepID=UPI001EDDBA1D|nr:endocuticle structural glycoprotein SgAbd-3-like isoform X1 [Daphnia pulex]XP_046446879.1 endocuticle structural glycoprotein SgAbd-3-like isoform X2 [Daphnia pulex]XP_046446880.1 endocuticle structural glycoprotein SgAbd-3-like isoform X3 [Daphnia pulex]XP_046446881.1 endocuticle structural glycoprotein SgAbd-3-like isoform X4 [Daphnia pulex]